MGTAVYDGINPWAVTISVCGLDSTAQFHRSWTLLLEVYSATGVPADVLAAPLTTVDGEVFLFSGLKLLPQQLSGSHDVGR